MTVRDPGIYVQSNAATQIGDGLWQLDLGFQDRAGVIAAYLLAGDGQLALIETGPSSCLPNLRAAIAQTGHDLSELTHALVTHIHLDHAGAAGPLARDNPELRVFVHPFGAPHLIDPSKLVASATRIYGDQMEPLWGEFSPIAESRVHALMDGELINVAGRRLLTAFTPGHAHHHVAYIDLKDRLGFTGDVGGVRMQGTEYVAPPTPPPDLDREKWWVSIDRLQGFELDRLYLTHFGEFRDVDRHLADLGRNLDEFLEIGTKALDAGVEPDELTRELHDRMSRGLGDAHPGVLVNLEWATPSYMATLGIIRWHKKQREATRSN
jgi:glyoxylase-like metal-dependent hydrolase (beta-lactamase superfamily II)